MTGIAAAGPMSPSPVSYTHLDVYKRQAPSDSSNDFNIRLYDRDPENLLSRLGDHKGYQFPASLPDLSLIHIYFLTSMTDPVTTRRFIYAMRGPPVGGDVGKIIG